jgi:hypothetical protein
MFRKRRRPTPNFKIPPPFNPVDGGFASLGIEGIMPYCAMMQIAADDEYDDYVICRGFDTRVVRFVDYEAGNPNKPGISVAKPFGCRSVRKYSIGQVYPAFLPIQGNATFTPPSPSHVNWRVGQNPGTVDIYEVNGGHPQDLDTSIEILYDHNGNAVNWILIHSANEQLYRFQALEDVVSDTFSATIMRMDGSDAFVGTVDDPDNIFLGMEAGTRGRAIYQDDKYYAMQAKCDPDEIV